MKRKMLALALVVICLAITAGGTLAYFNAKDTAHNVITSGNIDIKVVETQKDGETEVDYPRDPITGVMPGKEISKIVRVKNTGEGDAWIRVRVGKTVTLHKNAPEQLPGDQKPDLDLFRLDFNTTDWVRDDRDSTQYYDGEGVQTWYYNKTVAPGASTEPLFKNVKFAPEMGNAYQGCSLLIQVGAQAVQAKNNPVPADGTVLDIPGWPAAETPVSKNS